MPRDIPVGNGNLLVAFDRHYNLREFYYPYVGQENHTHGEQFRLGFWVDGRFSWVDGGWDIGKDYLDDTLVTDVRLANASLQLEVEAHDWVDFNENIYLKKMTVRNRAPAAREVRVFFHHDFHIYGSEVGDTANIQPGTRALFHYKEKRCFFINASAGGRQGFHQFATGNKELPNVVGTWRDAEDGVLGGNPIAQGAVDSVGAVHLALGAGESKSFFYWICAAQDWYEASRLNDLVLSQGPETFLRRTADYWRLWVTRESLNEALLPQKVARLYRRSLLIARTQIDNRGGILAANDADTMWFNRDTYSYVWTRDASMVAHAFDRAGYPGITRQYFRFCSRVIHHEGYFLHKYTPSGAEGSSWQPWLVDGHPQLPIQEDETALVVWALWEHFRRYRDVEFVGPLYGRLVAPAADFMLRYRDPATKLPKPSYDPWEERRGILTYTVSTTFAGLQAAANFAEAFGDGERAASCRAAAGGIRQAMADHLYLKFEKRFARMIHFRKDGTRETDAGLDASLFAAFAFGVFPPEDGKVAGTMQQLYDKLWSRMPLGGLARYEGDAYHRVSGEVAGNPWIICTLWLAQYYIASARHRGALQRALHLMEWAADRALPSGVLPEQVDPRTGDPLSVSPLTWSHGMFIIAVHEYLDRLTAADLCPVCGQPRQSKYARPPSPETVPVV